MSDIKRNEEWLQKNGKYKCPFCGKEYSKMGICSHIFKSHTDEGRKHKPFKNKQPWNKGLTKDTNETIKKMSDSLNLKIKNGEFKTNKGLKMSDEFKQKRRQEMLDRYANGFEVKCGRAPKYKYHSKIAGDITIDGSWELKVSKYLDSIGVEWIRNKKRFAYINELGKYSTYCPDFYIIDFDCYIEVKGYKTIKDDYKWSQFNENLQVWNKSKLIELNIL